MRRLSIIILTAVLTLTAHAQKVTFSSEGIEAGVRLHLGIEADVDILQSQTDTITALDLSGLGITDLRDIAYLPNVKVLDLSDNDITNVGPLNVLDSLRELDLRDNALESINLLAFSSSEKMTVDVTANYIDDFSYLFDCIKCQFTLIGMNRQMVKDALYFDVSQLYADVTDDDQPIVWYRGFTNMVDSPLMSCNEAYTEAIIDGHLNSMEVPGAPTTTAAVVLSCGEKTDTTYVVPPQDIELDGQTVLTLTTGLPEAYTIESAYAAHGSVEVEGTTMTYTVTDGDDDIVHFSYYKGNRLRGISRYHIKPRILLGDVNGDGVVNITDISLIVAHILGETLPVFIKQNADMNNDKSINVTDVTSVVGIVLNELAPKAPANARYDVDDRVVLAANSSGCSICLDGNAPFTACEMTLTLPEGCTLLDVSLDSHQPTSHQMAVHNIGDGRYRLVVYAPAEGRSCLGEGALVNLGLNGRSDGIKVSDIMFSNRQYETVVLQDAVGMTTGLDGVLSTDAADDTYSIQGIKTTTPRKGVYIKGHKKKVVKH